MTNWATKTVLTTHSPVNGSLRIERRNFGGKQPANFSPFILSQEDLFLYNKYIFNSTVKGIPGDLGKPLRTVFTPMEDNLSN